MKYSSQNLTLNLTLLLAEEFKRLGYDILWHATGDQEPQTAGLPTPQGEITLVPEFPANPTYVVRLNSEDDEGEEVVIPAFTLLLGPVRKLKRLGIGQKEFFRERKIIIDGFARDSFEQRKLADALYDWLDEKEQIPVLDYDSDPDTPPPLEPVWVGWVEVHHQELAGETDAVRYYIRAVATLRYVE